MLTAIVPGWNNWPLTHKALASLRGTGPKGMRVVLVDNGSTDETKSEAARLHPSVEIVRHSENLGFAAGSNSGLRYVEASAEDQVLFLNNDAAMLPGWWRKAVDRFSAESDLAVLGAQILDKSRTRVNHLGTCFTDETAGYRSDHPVLRDMRLPCHVYRDCRVAQLPKGARKARDLQAVTGACMMVRADVALRLGGFDEGYRNGFEDLDLCFRARFDLGLRVSIEPSMRCTHLESQTPGRFDHEEHNALRFAQRWADRIEADREAIIAADRYVAKPSSGTIEGQHPTSDQ